jgi:hypothetical protein
MDTDFSSPWTAQLLENTIRLLAFDAEPACRSRCRDNSRRAPDGLRHAGERSEREHRLALELRDGQAQHGAVANDPADERPPKRTACSLPPNQAVDGDRQIAGTVQSLANVAADEPGSASHKHRTVAHGTHARPSAAARAASK